MKKIIKKFFNEFENITKYYNFLVEKTKNHEYVEITNEWLIDNYYLLVEHKNNILMQKYDLNKNYKLISSNYLFLKNIVVQKNYNIDFKYLVDELKSYQKETDKVFTYKELSLIFSILIFIYTERLNELIIEEKQVLLNKDKVKEIIKSNSKVTLDDFLSNDFDVSKNPNYIFEINSKINKVSEGSAELFKDLYDFLENKNISLKELINEEYQRKIDNDILISNIFSDLKEFFEFSTDDLYEKVSLCEKLLLTDPVYKNMTADSKTMYRDRIVTLAKKEHLHEYKYLEKYFDEDKHIGYKLFPSKNNTFRLVMYILVIIGITTVVSYFLASHYTKYFILSILMIFIPISQLVIQIINEILNNNVPIRAIPKLDYSKGIPDESKTMVVIPTIVSDTKKIKEMFDTLETFYIINKSDNLYFTLLGDAKASSNEKEEYDEEVSTYGVEYATKLNEKYGKELFYFIYRKRVWHEGENAYLGYERKRGALLHFNKILLGKKVDEKKYFNVNMLHNNDLGIKYVITLDADTKLVLNTALNLVGAMAHPLNRPVLDKKNTKVIQGYGIMQPRVSVDIEATNKSLYSQIFAGIGGFDTYSYMTPNTYQDCFGEGSFVGKGIYDVEVFEKILSDAFKENLILSHDLLEGNYLRCGYVSDIELIDDFPSKFSVDVTRQSRWARGDTQIIGWLLPKVKNRLNKTIKNPINLLGKYKIFDNIVRMFLNPMLLITLLVAFTGSFRKSAFWVSFVILEIAVSMIFFLRSKMSRKAKNQKEIYYKNLYFGFKSLLLRSYIMFACIPYYTKLYMSAFFKSLYRLLISLLTKYKTNGALIKIIAINKAI